MKKILATALLASVSMGVMASPATCMQNWAKAQGADLTKQVSPLNQKFWGDGATFSWNKQGPTDGYEIKYHFSNANDKNLWSKGPWHCHCTYNPQYPTDDHFDLANGICGVW